MASSDRNIETSITVSAQRVHSLTEKQAAAGGYTHMVGKWVVVAGGLWGKWWTDRRCSTICVVDDFGDLVAVPA